MLQLKIRPPECKQDFPSICPCDLVFDLRRITELNKCHDDWLIIVDSKVLTSNLLTTDKSRSQKLTMRTSCSGELNIKHQIKSGRHNLRHLNI